MPIVRPQPDRGRFLGQWSGVSPTECPQGGARVQTNVEPVKGDPNALRVRGGVQLMTPFDLAIVPQWQPNTAYVLGDIARVGHSAFFCWVPHTSASSGGFSADFNSPDPSTGLYRWSRFYNTCVSVTPSFSNRPDEALPVVSLIQLAGKHNMELIGMQSFKPRILVPWTWTAPD